MALLHASGVACAAEVHGHRGARGLAPENTLAGFAAALEAGADWLELDVAVTRDGHVVVVHDPVLKGTITRDPQGRWVQEPGPAVNTLTLADLQRLDVGRMQPGTRYAAGFPRQRAVDGERVPTLAAVFDLVRARGNDRVRIAIETKISPLTPGLAPSPEDFVRAVMAVVDAHGLRSRVALLSFDWRILKAVQRLAPGVATVAITARQSWLDNVAESRWTAGLELAAHGGSVPRLVKAAGATAWSPHHADLDRDALAEARRLGLRVLPWTVNEEATMQRLLDWGVDGIVTDYPDRLRRIVDARAAPTR